MATAACPALLIAAPASGQGKTTVVAALARYHTRAGRRVRVFKTGPDFIDPTIHQLASECPVYQLDLWMVGEENCQQLLYEAACEADLILIEGVMGMFDGTPSSADLAKRFGMPVVAVVDAGAMAQTFGALCHGLSNYDPELPVAGVIANRVASERHEMLLRESLRPETRLLAALPRQADISLPERHLGLQLADELGDLCERLERAADLLEGSELTQLSTPVMFTSRAAPAPQATLPLAGRRIAIARDAAFAFVYPANLDLLQQLGAELLFFSPLHDTRLPVCDALYLPGGYPELHAAGLAANTDMKAAVGKAVGEIPCIAECGGMLYLLQELTDGQGQSFAMVGVIDGSARLGARVAGLGSLKAALGENEQGDMRGHTFHYSAFVREPAFHGYCRSNLTGRETEGLIRQGPLLASYAHWYFPSNPALVVQLLTSS